MGKIRMHKPDSRDFQLALAGVCSRDAGRLTARWRKLSRQAKSDPESWTALRESIAKSVARREARVASKPAVKLDPSLPITARADDIVKLIREHQVLVVAGATGSGKTTQLPKLCLAAGLGEVGLIGCTQPRRLAARSVARRVAQELGTEVGAKVGFQVRFTERVGDTTLVKFMTDGILLAETQSDPWLSQYDTLIIDEAHERSLNVDFLLGYLKRLLDKRPDLKLIVTSATIDTARFAEHFGGAPVVEVEGRGHPVEMRWRPPADRDESTLGEQVAGAVDEILHEREGAGIPGDILVFLPGEREIRDTHVLLSRRQYRNTEIMPLYARLSAADQDRVFKPGPARRVVLATNVAETSLTVPRIRYVVDCGTARVKRYSQRSQLERLRVEPISQAAADQRKGRCGRIGPGICVRLYDEADYAGRPRFTDPELLRSSLANVILRMLSLKLGEVEDFPFLDAPEPRAVADGYRRLLELSAVDADKHLTEIGTTLARLPIDVQLARMLIEARRLDVLPDVMTVVAFLSVQDPRERPADARQQADAAHARFADSKSDFVGMLKLWAAYREAHEDLTQAKLRAWCKRNFLNFLRMREWREVHRQLLLVARDLWGAAVNTTATGIESDSKHPSFEAIHRSLLSGLPTQVGRKDDKAWYRGPRERKFQVFPGSALAKSPPNWIFAAQILDLGGKVWGMLCAAVEPGWIEQQAAHLVRKSWLDPHWSRTRGAVIAHEQVSLFGMNLVERRTVTFRKQDPELAHNIFLCEALVTCEIDARAAFVHSNASILAEARDIEARERRQGLLRPDAELAEFFCGKLPADMASSRALDAWHAKASAGEKSALCWTLADVLEPHAGLDKHAFPAVLELDGQRYLLEYRFIPGDEVDGVTLHLPLALLNTLPALRCEWLVPGLLADKVAEMIRGLPKGLRRNFVPAPEFARAFVEAEAPRGQSLAVALSRFLTRTTGVELGQEAFADRELPAHLSMRFRLHDDAGKTLHAGRDLAAMRVQWQARARGAFSRKAGLELDGEALDAWPADDIPEQISASGKPDAYPALVDLGTAVALRVFERREQARAAHVGGVDRMLRNSLEAEIKRAHRKLPLAKSTALKHAPFGSTDALRHDLVQGAVDDVLAGLDRHLRTRAAFEELLAECSRVLFTAAIARLQLIEQIIDAQAALTPWLRPLRTGQSEAAYADLREQLDALLVPGFARTVSRERMAHFPRYLQAMRIRAERLRLDPARDRQRQSQVEPFWQCWQQCAASDHHDAELEHFRWLIEEWRVSLFAQELKTAEPVSAKRLRQAQQRLGPC